MRKKSIKTKTNAKRAEVAKAPSAADTFRRRIIDAPETAFTEAYEQWGDGLAETSARVVYLNTRATMKALHHLGKLKR